MFDPASIPFSSWRTGAGLAAYTRGYEMGIRHARTGDPSDYSDARCAPLVAEQDSTASEYPMGPIRGAFHGGYEAGYEEVLSSESQ